MFEASVAGWFAAAHQLRLTDGTLEPLHGHNWHVRITYAAETLDEMGVVVDFVAVRRRLDAVLATLHDRNLNDLPPFAQRNPSAENVALFLAEELALPRADRAFLRVVDVEEAPGCVARYAPPSRT